MVSVFTVGGAKYARAFVQTLLIFESKARSQSYWVNLITVFCKLDPFIIVHKSTACSENGLTYKMIE